MDESGANPTVAELDARLVNVHREIQRVLSAILHHPEFKTLEARWASLRMLVDSLPTEPESGRLAREVEAELVVSIWNVSQEELAEDLRFADSFQNCVLYQRVYREAYNMAGGQPFGILVGDYAFSDHPDDLAMLRDIAQVAAAAFSPFVAAADPLLFRIERFEELYDVDRAYLRERAGSPLVQQFDQSEYGEWNEFRRTPDSRYVGLTIPRILLRRPYDERRFLGYRAAEAERDEPESYREPRRHDALASHLWGNPAFAFAQVILNSFWRSGWLADIHGVPGSPTRGGVVPLVVVDEFMTDGPGVPRFTTDVLITDGLEKDLSHLGFLCLTHRHHTPYASFCSVPSLHEPEEFVEAAARVSERMSSMFHYMLCVCRIAHYVKKLGHEMVGSAGSAEDFQKRLAEFLGQFVLNDENAALELKAQQPLSKAAVDVLPVPGKPGHYHCEITLKPHYELDAVEIRLTTEVTAVSEGRFVRA